MKQKSFRKITNEIVALVTLLVFMPVSFAGEVASPKEISSPVPELTLPEVIKEAIARNPEIEAAHKNWEAEKAKIWTQTLPDPQIGVEYWGKNETCYDVSQTVPFPGKMLLKRRAQAHEAKRQFELYDAKKKEILQKVKAAYYSYYLAWRQVEIFEESVNFLKDFSAVAEKRYSVNEAPQVDVLKAQLEYSKALNTLITLGQDKESMQADLNALLDRHPNVTLGRPGEPPLPSKEFRYEDLEQVALENRPEVHAARHHVDHMKAELHATEADFLPDAMLQYSRRTFSGTDMKDDNIVMVKFNVPILWFWRQGSQVKAAKKAKEGAEAELRSTETMTRADLKSMGVKVGTARRLVDLYRTTLIPQAENALRVSLTGYEGGTLRFLDLLDSERSWLDFQLEYCEALAKYWTYLASLERVIGKDISHLDNLNGFIGDKNGKKS